jgi:hypothetical protein
VGGINHDEQRKTDENQTKRTKKKGEQKRTKRTPRYVERRKEEGNDKAGKSKARW